MPFNTFDLFSLKIWSQNILPSPFILLFVYVCIITKRNAALHDQIFLSVLIVEYFPIVSFLFLETFSKEMEKRVEHANSEVQKLLSRIEELKNEEKMIYAKYFNVRDQMNGLIDNITEYRSFLHQVASSVKNTQQVNYTFFLK